VIHKPTEVVSNARKEFGLDVKADKIKQFCNFVHDRI
jgi:hypothetical protein